MTIVSVPAASLALESCRTVPNEPVGSPPTVDLRAVESYPFGMRGLRSPLTSLMREDGEGLYKLALDNDRALRQYYAETPLCVCPGASCGDLSLVDRALRQREKAMEQQLALRLDAMEAAVEGYRGRQASQAGSDFGRFRALIETLARDRMQLLRTEILHCGCGPARFRAPPGAFFVAYYTAWLRLSRDLPPTLRKEFFTDIPDMPK